jgi:hypothetical protein
MVEISSKPESMTAADQESCREEMERILSSKTFAKAPRLCSLFDYICRHSLQGHLEDLTEQQIGIHVFHRLPGYNSAEDTIVRGTARYLRQRLDLYYQEEGQTDAVRITVPKGSYVGHFRVAEPSPSPELGTLATASTPALPPAASSNAGVDAWVQGAWLQDAKPGVVPRHSGWPRSAWITTALLLLIAAASLVTGLRSRPTRNTAKDSGPEILWRMLFTPGRKTLIVPGDASLDVFTSFDQRRVTLPEYTEQYYQSQASPRSSPTNGDVPLSKRSVTPMADLRLVSELVRVPQRIGLPEAEEWTEIRYARDMAAGDLRNSNLILIGSETFNPWVTLYQPSLDFNVHWDFTRNTYTVSNKAPRAGEPASYTYDPKSGSLGALSAIAFVENTQGRGNVLLVQGTSMGTTYGALNFLLNEHLWKPVVQAATDSSGHLRNFEVVLQNDFIRGGVSNTRILTIHVHDRN